MSSAALSHGYDGIHSDRGYQDQKVIVSFPTFLVTLIFYVSGRWARANIRNGQAGVTPEDVYGNRK
jgi:hypothetical protein